MPTEVIEALIIVAAFSCLALVAALWPRRRCQTCGRRVKTYCQECEDRSAPGYGADD